MKSKTSYSIYTVMKNFLFEEVQEPAQKRKRNKKVAEETPAEEQIRRMIDVSVGDFSAQIPESALDTVIAFIRELLMADLNTSDVIELILTQVREGGRSQAEVELIEKILRAIDKKFDPEFINKIPSTFPFLDAVGKDVYPLASLNPESLALLNFHKKKIGRGEVAIPLLFGIDKFAADDDTDQKGINSYDLVYNGQRADIKDYRKDTGGKLIDSKELRLGEPASDAFTDSATAGLASSPIAFVKDFAPKDFASQQAGANALIEAFKEQLDKIAPKKLGLMTKSDVKKELSDAVKNISQILDKSVRDVIEEKYPGGFFTITTTEIRIVQSAGFGFNRLTGGGKRLNVSPITEANPVTNFAKGLQQQVDNRLASVYEFIEAKTKKQIDDGTIDDVIKNAQAADQETNLASMEQPVEREPAEDTEQQQSITETLLRRLIRSL